MPDVSKKVPSVKKPTELAKKFDNRTLFLGVVILASVFTWAFLNKQINVWVSTFFYEPTQLVLPSTKTQLYLDPQTKAVQVGDTFGVNIMLNTFRKPVDGVDIYSLHYDPSLLSVVDDDPAKKGIQIQTGSILPVNAANMVDEKTGTIKLSQLANGGTSFSGEGILATVHFKAVRSGTNILKFDFYKGSTVDSNAAWRGKDQLSSVVDAIYTITEK